MLRRTLFLISIILFLFSSVDARARYNGIAGKGGKLVKTAISTSYKLQETYPFCTVTVYLAGTTTIAAIYSDNSGTVKANPFSSDSVDASYFFYADNGRYDIKFSGVGIITPFTKADIMLNDAIDYAPLFASDYVIGDGIVDDTIALQALINLGISTGKPIQLETGATYRITSTLSIVSGQNFKIIGTAPSGALSRITILWNGANGGTVLLVDRCYLCEIGGFRITDGTPGSGSRTIGVGIDIDDLGAGNISSGNYFHDIGIYNATTGIRIGNVSTANNDLHIFDRVDVRLDPIAAGTIAVLIDDTQSKWHTFRNSSFGFADKGIAVTTGSFNSYTCGFSHNNRDIYIVNPSDQISLYSPQSETAGRFLETDSNPTLIGEILIVGGRLSPDAVNADNNYVFFNKHGNLHFIGTSLSAGTNLPNFQIFTQGSSATLNANVQFDNCLLPDNTFTSGANRKTRWQNSMFTTGGGSLAKLDDTSTSDSAAENYAYLGTVSSTSFTDGFVTYTSAQQNRAGGAITIQNGATAGSDVQFFASATRPFFFSNAGGWGSMPKIRPDAGGTNGNAFEIQAFNAANNWETVFSATNKTSGKIDAELVGNGGNVLINNAIVYSTGTPVVTGDGTIVTNSKNSNGKILSTVTAVATITVTFSGAFTRAPACVASNETTANLVKASSTTTVLTLIGTTVTGDSIAYQCLGY